MIVFRLTFEMASYLLSARVLMNLLILTTESLFERAILHDDFAKAYP